MKARHIGWIAAFGLVLAGCAQPPTADIEAANQALDEARQAQAAEYAPQTWTTAQDAKAKLDVEMSAQEQRWSATRTYTIVRQLAQDTKAIADRSRDEAVAGKEKVKAEATTMMAEAQTAVERAQAAVASAPKGKGTEADLASLKSDTASLDDTLAEMRKSFDAGQYNDAKVKAQAAIDTAKQVETEIEKAKSQRRSA
jgi:hypothetical protein